MKYDEDNAIQNINCLYVNGCSLTVGDEMPDKIKYSCRYSALLAKYFDVEEINNAKGGGSNARILRTGIQDITKLLDNGKKPFVIIAWTAEHRFEACHIDSNQWLQFNAGEKSIDPEFEKIYWSRYGSDYGNKECFAVQAYLMETFLKSLNIPYLMLHAFNPVVLPRDSDLENFCNRFDYRYFLPDLTLKGYLSQWPDLEYGPGGHPLQDGHFKIYEFVKDLIEKRYAIRKL